MKQFDYLATKAKGTLIASDKSVLDSHLYRIEKMDELAQKTYEAVCAHLERFWTALIITAKSFTGLEAKTSKCFRGPVRSEAGRRYSCSGRANNEAREDRACLHCCHYHFCMLIDPWVYEQMLISIASLVFHGSVLCNQHWQLPLQRKWKTPIGIRAEISLYENFCKTSCLRVADNLQLVSQSPYRYPSFSWPSTKRNLQTCQKRFLSWIPKQTRSG